MLRVLADVAPINLDPVDPVAEIACICLGVLIVAGWFAYIMLKNDR